MTDDTGPSAKVKKVAEVWGAETAPIIYFDGPAASGILAGIIQIELAALARVSLEDGGTVLRPVAVARLRTTHDGFLMLKDAIKDIEALLSPSDAKSN